jgi:alpha-ribazole phosphatase/probable phosphoglycerate mutase
MAGTFCGHSDPELNARGHVQLNDLIDKVRTEDISAVYASDLRRAHATATAIAKAFAVDLHVRRALREINFGQWEGLTWKEIEQRDETFARRWAAEYPHQTAPDGESFRDFKRRVLNEVQFLSSRTENHRIAVVTHAGVMRTLVCALYGRSEKNAWEQTRSYCSLVRYTCPASSFMHSDEVRS